MISETTTTAGGEGHTPLPWIDEVQPSTHQSVHGSRCVSFITSVNGANVADVCDSAGMSEEEARMNARLIVAAVNNYATLRAALQLAEKYLAKRLLHTGGEGETVVLPAIRAALTSNAAAAANGEME